MTGKPFAMARTMDFGVNTRITPWRQLGHRGDVRALPPIVVQPFGVKNAIQLFNGNRNRSGRIGIRLRPDRKADSSRWHRRREVAGAGLGQKPDTARGTPGRR